MAAPKGAAVSEKPKAGAAAAEDGNNTVILPANSDKDTTREAHHPFAARLRAQGVFGVARTVIS